MPGYAGLCWAGWPLHADRGQVERGPQARQLVQEGACRCVVGLALAAHKRRQGGAKHKGVELVLHRVTSALVLFLLVYIGFMVVSFMFLQTTLPKSAQICLICLICLSNLTAGRCKYQAPKALGSKTSHGSDLTWDTFKVSLAESQRILAHERRVLPSLNYPRHRARQSRLQDTAGVHHDPEWAVHLNAWMQQSTSLQPKSHLRFRRSRSSRTLDLRRHPSQRGRDQGGQGGKSELAARRPHRRPPR